jgi:hypothetical protein
VSKPLVESKEGPGESRVSGKHSGKQGLSQGKVRRESGSFVLFGVWSGAVLCSGAPKVSLCPKNDSW